MTPEEQRRAFFSRIDPFSEDTDLPDAWTSRRTIDDPIARFRGAQSVVKGRVIDVPNRTVAFREVNALLVSLAARSVVCNDEPPIDEWVVNDGTHVDVHRLKDHKQDPAAWRRLCAAADAGITAADALLAETGTVVCSSGPGRSRMVSLLPPVHIVICSADRFTTDVFTWLAAHDGRWPANTVLISGPSKTADIEQTMSVGMHGPKQLITVIYHDEAV